MRDAWLDEGLIMMRGMDLLSSLMGKKRMGKEMGDGESSVSITIEKEMEKPDEMMGGGRMRYAKGGRIDGCAIRGKTKGTYR